MNGDMDYRHTDSKHLHIWASNMCKNIDWPWTYAVTVEILHDRKEEVFQLIRDIFVTKTEFEHDVFELKRRMISQFMPNHDHCMMIQYWITRKERVDELHGHTIHTHPIFPSSRDFECNPTSYASPTMFGTTCTSHTPIL